MVDVDETLQPVQLQRNSSKKQMSEETLWDDAVLVVFYRTADNTFLAVLDFERKRQNDHYLSSK